MVQPYVTNPAFLAPTFVFLNPNLATSMVGWFLPDLAFLIFGLESQEKNYRYNGGLYIYTRANIHTYIYTHMHMYMWLCVRVSQYANRKYRIGVRLCKYWYALQSLRFILNQLWVPLSGQRPIELHCPGSLTSYSVRACTAADGGVWTQLADLYAWVIQGEIQNMSIWVSDQIKKW